MARTLLSQWIMRYPDGTLASAQLTYHHGRHRYGDVVYSGGHWWRNIRGQWPELIESS